MLNVLYGVAWYGAVAKFHLILTPARSILKPHPVGRVLHKDTAAPDRYSGHWRSGPVILYITAVPQTRSLSGSTKQLPVVQLLPIEKRLLRQVDEAARFDIVRALVSSTNEDHLPKGHVDDVVFASTVAPVGK